VQHTNCWTYTLYFIYFIFILLIICTGCGLSTLNKDHDDDDDDDDVVALHPVYHRISVCLPRVLVPSILPSKTVRRMDSLLNIHISNDFNIIYILKTNIHISNDFNTWPNQFFCLCRVVFIQLLFSSTMSKTS